MSETPSPTTSDAAEAVRVSVQEGKVLVQGPDAAAFALTPDAAVRAAERLLEAADQARSEQPQGSDQRPKPPFPPYELVSPHGAS